MLSSHALLVGQRRDLNTINDRTVQQIPRIDTATGTHIPRCYVESLQQLLTLREVALRLGSPYSCTLCGQIFRPKKAFLRHLKQMNDHGGTSFICRTCGVVCSRKDVLARHEATQHHSDDRQTVQCSICHEHIRPRCLSGHQQSQACRKAATKAAEFGTSQPHRFAKDHCYAYLAAPSCPPVIIDCVLLSAWLFVKVAPWGPRNRAHYIWLESEKVRLRTPTCHEIVKLQLLLFESIRKASTLPDAAYNAYLFDAIELLTVTSTMTNGWETAQTHRHFVLNLAWKQIVASGHTRASFTAAEPAEAFESVLLKAINNEAERPKCLDVVRKTIVMMRSTAYDSTLAITQGLSRPMEMSAVRAFTGRATPEVWVKLYERQLLGIAEVAGSIGVGQESFE